MPTATDSFRDFYVERYAGVVAAIVAVTLSRSDAEDIAADAFAIAFERWEKVEVMEHPERWLVTVALNVARRRFRRRAMEQRILNAVGATPRNARLVESDEVLSEQMVLALRKLTAKQREALALRYIEDLSQVGVAGRMRVAPGTASATLVGARARLRQEWEAISDGTR